MLTKNVYTLYKFTLPLRLKALFIRANSVNNRWLLWQLNISRRPVNIFKIQVTIKRVFLSVEERVNIKRPNQLTHKRQLTSWITCMDEHQAIWHNARKSPSFRVNDPSVAAINRSPFFSMQFTNFAPINSGKMFMNCVCVCVIAVTPTYPGVMLVNCMSVYTKPVTSNSKYVCKVLVY